MKKLLLALLAFFAFGISINAQTDSSTATAKPAAAAAQTDDAKPKRQIFRAKKDTADNQ